MGPMSNLEEGRNVHAQRTHNNRPKTSASKRLPGNQESPREKSPFRPVSYTHLDVYKRQLPDRPFSSAQDSWRDFQKGKRGLL